MYTKFKIALQCFNVLDRIDHTLLHPLLCLLADCTSTDTGRPQSSVPLRLSSVSPRQLLEHTQKQGHTGGCLSERGPSSSTQTEA